ncbi:MAG TPA: SpoIID/LytB domain-containing protein, partial [Ilumatobacter sp.]|nr:SpoIID/LytB domain-containing protein [Ilumatobacter sp.]
MIPGRRVATRLWAGVAILLGAVAVPLAVAPASVSHAAPPGIGEIVAYVARGVGNGHGRGLSQWGAFGRAVNGGQSWQQILDTYYAGTVNGNRGEAAFRVRLTDWDDHSTFGVISASGQARWNGSATDYSSLYAVEVGSNSFQVYGSSSLGCPGGSSIPVPTVDMAVGASGDMVRQLQTLLNHFGAALGVDGSFGNQTRTAVIGFQNSSGLTADGEWHVEDWNTAQSRLAGEDSIPWTLLTPSPVAGPIVFSTPVDAGGAPSGAVLGACEVSGSITHYRGTLQLLDTAGPNRVVNQLDVELYLRGVVPREVSASWGSAGGGAGMNALRAQAVAARSYALNETRYSYAKTCDTSSCQVYGGAATRPAPTSAGFVGVEHVLSNQGIADTASVVRLRNGAVVSTEFSASNGPRTAGGSFPAVDDPWDDVPGNPLHTWTRVIDADAIATKYGLSNGNGIATIHDSGSGFDGIWANEVVVNGALLASAWDFRNAFGLPSPGFELLPITRGVATSTGLSFIGDSVGVSIADNDASELRVLLEGVFGTATFDSIVARRTQGGSIADGVSAANAVPLGTELVVVELGYNDEVGTMASRIDAVMTALRNRQVQRVAWVNLSQRRSEFTATNAAIAAAAARWSELVVFDWKSASDGAAGNRWFSDNVHLTATGRSEFALFLRDRMLPLAGGVSARTVVPGAPLRVGVLNRFGVPAVGVKGVALNVTAVNPADAGWLRVWPCGSPEPATSAVNYAFAGAVEPNAVVVPVDATGEVCVATMTATEVVVDVSGWFSAGLESATGRLVDTREDGAERTVVPGSPLRVGVLNRFGVPGVGVKGVALNVTAVNP